MRPAYVMQNARQIFPEDGTGIRSPGICANSRERYAAVSQGQERVSGRDGDHTKNWAITIMNIRNEIKAHIVREGTTMNEVVRTLAAVHGWSSSVPNLSDKLRRGTLRYSEAVELADVLGYDIVWKKREREHRG